MEKNLIDIIAKSGIVGAGGAGFPTHVKMNAKAEYVIINGAECEPLLRVDQQLMAVETKKILDALEANGSPKPEFETDEARSYFITRLFVHEGFWNTKHEDENASTPNSTPSTFISFQTSIRLVMNRLQYTKLREELYQKVEFLYSVALSFPM